MRSPAARAVDLQARARMAERPVVAVFGKRLSLLCGETAHCGRNRFGDTVP